MPRERPKEIAKRQKKKKKKRKKMGLFMCLLYLSREGLYTA